MCKTLELEIALSDMQLESQHKPSTTFTLTLKKGLVSSLRLAIEVRKCACCVQVLYKEEICSEITITIVL